MGKFAELKKRYPYLGQQVGLYGTILLVLIAAYFFVQYYNNSQSVALAKPTESITSGMRAMLSSQYPPEPVGGIPRMDDPKWKDVKIGESNQTIGENGSLLCALAFLAPPNSMDELTPDEVNARLMEAGAYAENDNLDWEKASEALAWDFQAYTGFSPDLAITAMKTGKSVLVKVRLRDNVAHWVSIYYASPDGYMAADPLTGESVELSQYGRVYTLVTAQHLE